jgi:hypothetical protein
MIKLNIITTVTDFFNTGRERILPNEYFCTKGMGGGWGKKKKLDLKNHA